MMTISWGLYFVQIFSTVRASRSLDPPGEKGTITWIGWDGYFAAPKHRPPRIEMENTLTISNRVTLGMRVMTVLLIQTG